MEAFNFTPSEPLTFILRGIPGLEAAHIWISISFSIFYIIGLMGSFTILFVVNKEQTLHKPMYLLICMLAITDIGTSTVVMPKTLSILWFSLNIITLDGCLTQMFFYHTFNAMHSAVLVTMAFDRYVAICYPLNYATILTNARIAKLGLIILIRAVLIVLPDPLLLRRLPFCASHVIPHTYCEFMSVVKLSCADTTVNQTFGVVIAFVFGGLDLTLIGLSYGLIFRALLKMSSKKAYQKALNTCTAHLWVVLITYTPFLFSTMTHRFSQGINAHIHVLLANFYLFLPLMLNPLIYGVKSKELREKLRKYTGRVFPPWTIDLKSM